MHDAAKDHFLLNDYILSLYYLYNNSDLRFDAQLSALKTFSKQENSKYLL